MKKQLYKVEMGWKDMYDEIQIEEYFIEAYSFEEAYYEALEEEKHHARIIGTYVLEASPYEVSEYYG